MVSSELYRSYPAAKAEPRVGARAFGERSWIWSGGGASVVACEGIEADSVAIFGGGDLNSSTGWFCC